jgi:uridine kinase
VGGNVDRERFLQEVLQPLGKGETVKYRKFDCGVMHMGEEIHVEPKTLTVIEGAYSMHPELAKYYDFSVFLDISPELQKERIQKRNEPQLAKRFFEEWIPLERQYFCKMKIKEYCDIQISIDSKCVKIKN